MKNITAAFCLLIASPLHAEDAAPTPAPAKPAAAQTPIKSHGQFEFSMPGEWKLTEIPKQETDGPVIYPGSGTTPGGVLSYLAFEFPGQKVADQKLENFPGPVCEPIIAKLEKAGGKEVSRGYEELVKGQPDRGYFHLLMKSPAGEEIHFSGIVVRTTKRVYVIQQMGPNVTKDSWVEIVKSFKEL
ncbi:MAG: hypothetical protein QM755_22385 [Luteolibacter sp.]